MTQSTCAGGDGCITVCSTNPGNAATILPVSTCHAANAASLSGRTRVCTTIVALPIWSALHSMAVMLAVQKALPQETAQGHRGRGLADGALRHFDVKS